MAHQRRRIEHAPARKIRQSHETIVVTALSKEECGVRVCSGGNMRYNWPYFCMLAILAGSISSAQTPAPPPPQSARQALIEMFVGKGPDDFVKHLPEDARH